MRYSIDKGWHINFSNMKIRLCNYGSSIFIFALCFGFSSIVLIGIIYLNDSIEDARNIIISLSATCTIVLVAIRFHMQGRQVKVSETGLATERFIKAAELLGSTKENPPKCGSDREIVPNIPSRLGAIYSLERLAIESQTEQEFLFPSRLLFLYIRQFALSTKLPTYTYDEETNYLFDIPGREYFIEVSQMNLENRLDIVMASNIMVGLLHRADKLGYDFVREHERN